MVTQKDLQLMTRKGGFHLRKWLRNSKSVMEAIPEDDRARSNSTVLITDHEQLPADMHKALGVAWSPAEDEFTFVYPEPEAVKFTPRGVLSQMCRLFDPRGQLCPFTIRSRVLFQETCIRGTRWDEPLDDDQIRDWKTWFEEFPQLSLIKAKRCFTDVDCNEPLSLHTFTDASALAYAAVTYARQELPDGTAKTTLAVAKARPAPIRRKTIPMLELQGAVLGARLSQMAGKALDVPADRQHYWTDSMNVLYWIKSPSRKFKVDVGNRISEIQEETLAAKWHHVSTKENPADIPSRGAGAMQLATDRKWWNGPDFITASEDSWPRRQIIPPAELPGQLKQTVTMVSIEKSSPKIRLHPDNYSSWNKLVRVTAWCRRFMNNARQHTAPPPVTCSALKSVSIGKGSLVVAELTTNELRQAEHLWINSAQKEVHGEVFHDLEKGHVLSASSPLQKLQPILDVNSGVPAYAGQRTSADSPSLSIGYSCSSHLAKET